jgi:hypothetical protein
MMTQSGAIADTVQVPHTSTIKGFPASWKNWRASKKIIFLPELFLT